MSHSHVRRSTSGLFLRTDKNLGLVVYSPYSGMIYAVHPTLAKQTAKWLLRGQAPPDERIRQSLGTGWATGGTGEFPIPHLLPSRAAWSTVSPADDPILVNWFITGMCPLACRYCYAEDLMRDRRREPTKALIQRIGRTILSYGPVVVVLTGGDPLFSGHLKDAVEVLSGRVGILLDTSGYTLRPEHLALLKEHQVTVRVSFDSQRLKVNQQLRPLYPDYRRLVQSGRSTLEAAVDCICACLDAGITVGVQTVATKKNANDLVDLGDRLHRLGVTFWRVLKVAPSATNRRVYERLVGGRTDSGRRLRLRNREGPYAFVFTQLLRRHRTAWRTSMGLQVTFNERPSSVILVSSDGAFYTESNVGAGKLLIDPRSPRRPRRIAMVRSVDMPGHTARYLNLTSDL